MNLNDDQLDETLRTLVPDAMPPAIEQRLRSQLADFRAGIAASETPRVPSAGRWPGARARKVGLAAAAAALVLGALYLVLQPRVGFADVAVEVLRQPWIHMKIVDPNKRVTEAWFSAEKQISAESDPDRTEFHDHRLQVHYLYETTELTLYRLPEFTAGNTTSVESTIAVLARVAGDERAAEVPLESLAMFGGRGVQIVSQRLEKTTEKGENWLDFHLTVRMAELPEPIEMLFRVDARTKLLRLCRMTGRDKGTPATREIAFDYPQTGPADIYALGVPLTAPLVDRVPTGDLKRIVESLKAGRERMDNYRAIFTSTDDGLKNPWQNAWPTVFYRKGDWFRADGRTWMAPGSIAEPPAGTDMHAWYHKRVRAFRFFPQTIIRGPMTYSIDRKPVTDADGSEYIDVVKVHEYKVTGEHFPPEYSMMPEFSCRPPMGIGAEYTEPLLDLHPAEGPAGCIVLNVARKDVGRIKGSPDVKFMPDGWRYWLDPQRDYIVMRWEMVNRDEAGNESITSKRTVEEVARSPQGVWYAKRIRVKNNSTRPDGTSNDEIYHIFVDFDVDLPDAMFDPPKSGRIR